MDLMNRLRSPSGFLCRSPFEYVHIQANGDVYPCCPSKFGRVIGDLTTQKLRDVWCSPAAQEVRDSIVDGSYRFCNADACEYLRDALAKNEELSPPVLVAWAQGERLLEWGTTPKVINLAFDLTCNLRCNYCRREAFRLSNAARQRIVTIDSNLFESLSDHTERIVLLGEGDPFASPIYREKLQNYDWGCHPNIKIKIQTNGLLLTAAMWDTLQSSHPAIDWISISIDAATPSTYKVNRSGDFNHLLRNLDFIANLRALRRIKRFSISFLVQTNNFREMPAFVRMGKRLGCDLIEFQRLENWATFSDKEYKKRAIHQPCHPDHRELLLVLQDPELQHDSVWILKLGPHVHGTASVGVMSWDDCNETNSG